MVAAVESKSKKSKQVPEETIYDSPNEDVEVEEEKEDSKKGAAKAGDLSKGFVPLFQTKNLKKGGEWV